KLQTHTTEDIRDMRKLIERSEDMDADQKENILYDIDRELYYRGDGDDPGPPPTRPGPPGPGRGSSTKASQTPGRRSGARAAPSRNDTPAADEPSSCLPDPPPDPNQPGSGGNSQLVQSGDPNAKT